MSSSRTSDEYDTVGGLVFHRIGGVPKPGDVVRLKGVTITVESTDGRRVSKVLVNRERADRERRHGIVTRRPDARRCG